MYPSQMTMNQLVKRVLYHLGDAEETTSSTRRIWDRDEIITYLKEGLRNLVVRTEILWDMAYLEDLPFASNYTAPWEKAWFQPGEVFQSDSSFNFPWEWEWQVQKGGLGPSNHDQPWEVPFLLETYLAARVRLPERVLKIDRAVNGNRRLLPPRSSELRDTDALYETTTGTVEAYTLDGDSPRVFRKWRIPATPASQYNVIGRWGTLRSGFQETGVVIVAAASVMRIDEFAIVPAASVVPNDGAFLISAFFDGFDPSPTGATTSILTIFSFGLNQIPEFSSAIIPGGDGFAELAQEDQILLIPTKWGIVRRFPGYHPMGHTWGIPRRLAQNTANTRIEFFRKPHVPAGIWDNFELPRYMLRYLRFYAMGKAYRRRGPGQDLKLADHYEGRYDRAVARVIKRKNAFYRSRRVILGGSASGESRRVPRAQPPWQVVKDPH